MTPPPPIASMQKMSQCNVQGLRPKRHHVLQAVVGEDLDVVCLQSKLVPASFEWRVVGYTFTEASPIQ